MAATVVRGATHKKKATSSKAAKDIRAMKGSTAGRCALKLLVADDVDSSHIVVGYGDNRSVAKCEVRLIPPTGRSRIYMHHHRNNS